LTPITGIAILIIITNTSNETQGIAMRTYELPENFKDWIPSKDFWSAVGFEGHITSIKSFTISVEKFIELTGSHPGLLNHHTNRYLDESRSSDWDWPPLLLVLDNQVQASDGKHRVQMLLNGLYSEKFSVEDVEPFTDIEIILLDDGSFDLETVQPED